jgi:hypothetical protein
MQWLTGLVAELAAQRGWPVYDLVFGAIALMLVLGAVAFALLPQPGRTRSDRTT